MRSSGSSDAEERLWHQCAVTCLRPLPERQYPWAKAIGRKFKADFAWPSQKILVEIDGSVHRIKGRFRESMGRDNLAVALGWRQFKVSRQDVISGKALDAVSALLGNGDLIEVLQRRGTCIPRTTFKKELQKPAGPRSLSLSVVRWRRYSS